MKLIRTAILLLMMILVSSCSLKKTNLNPSDQNLLNQIIENRENKSLKTLKGVGNATIVADGNKSSFRLAFAAEKPCKLRLVALAGGQPIETIASNCYNIYMLSHKKKHSFYKKKLTGYTLESLINIPVTTEEILQFMTGGYPVKPHDYVEMVNENNNKVILLKKHWSGIQQKIQIKDGKIGKITIYSSGKPVYSVNLNFKNSGSFRISDKIIFYKDSRNHFQLELQRLWPNARVKSSMFVLTPKD